MNDAAARLFGVWLGVCVVVVFWRERRRDAKGFWWKAALTLVAAWLMWWLRRASNLEVYAFWCAFGVSCALLLVGLLQPRLGFNPKASND